MQKIALPDGEGFKPAAEPDLQIALLLTEAEKTADPGLRGRMYAQAARHLNRQGRYGPAWRLLDRAAVLAPDEPDVLRSLGLAMFGRGQWEEGLALYDRGRWRLSEFDKYRRAFPFPEWQGEPVAGKRLLLWAEQGIGDQIMQIRALAPLVAMGAEVHLESDPRVHPIVARVAPGITCHTQTRELPAHLVEDRFDFHGSLLSAWRWAGLERGAGAYLTPDPALVERFRKAWADQGWTINIGVSWRSRAAANGTKRSLPEDMLRLLLPPDGVACHALQYDTSTEELTRLSNRVGRKLWHDTATDATQNIDRLMAQIAALDLVVSIDNSTVHTAGAVGTETWVLLPSGADWRWGPEGTETPLYRDLRLFRNRQEQLWGGVVAETVDALGQWIAARGAV